MNLPGGKLRIKIERSAEGVRATVTPPPVLLMSDLLRGKTAEETASFIPLVFNICAAAQEAAARSALSLSINDDLRAQVVIETLREHTIKLLMVWPALLGVETNPNSVHFCTKAMDDDASEKALRSAVFGESGYAPSDGPSFDRWMRDGGTAPAKTFSAIARNWDAAWGRTDTPLFDIELPVDWKTAKQNGVPVDNGPVCRVADAPLLLDIEDQYGRGMLWRMTARLVEVDRILSGHHRNVIPHVGIAQAARGAMLVRAEYDQSEVRDFGRLSPTDFALCKDGVMDQALVSLRDVPAESFDVVARMIVETIDPCVVTEVETVNA